ncbi:unnamed protein product [Angiostrongylus costaricensis]|uniref:SERPIN domain-containing protein n=1 Tax=Angiostrongylus costaricensis TaxID=334426 RepID=A0A0R3PND1_ANGCS|nr:unnamed protein product [Angiostrongylus costaricensis]
MRVFIIPWLMFAITVKAQDTVVTPSHGQLLDASLYQFLQRQNQINNAIMLNNALLANSLVTVPTNEHQIRLPNTLQFPVTSLPPLFHKFPQTMATVPIAGLNRLGIYDVLSNVRAFDDIKYPLIHSQNKDERSEKKDNVYNLLRTFNLTDEETKDIVKRVEKFLDFDLYQIVRDELVKKLSEVRLTGRKNPPDVSQESTTLVSTMDATTQDYDWQMNQRLGFYVGVLETDLLSECSGDDLFTYHGFSLQYLSSKTVAATYDIFGCTHNRSNFVEAEIFTAQLHLPIEEKMVDEKSYDDLPISNEEQLTMELDGAFPVSMLIFVEEVYSIASATCDDTEVFECLEHLKDQEYEMSATSTSSTVQLATDIARPQASTPSETLPTTQIHEVTNNTKKAITKSRNGIDANALNMKFVTGAPLDLDNEDNHAVAYRNRNLHRSASSTNPPAPTFPKPSGKPRYFTHPKTPFERLVVDYKQRLAGGMDIDKILKSIYSNAYIALIDAKDAPKVQIPLSMRRAEITLG